MRQKIKTELQIHVEKKQSKTPYARNIILKGNITTYIEHKHKNTKPCVLIYP